jgi:hypothetical protein
MARRLLKYRFVFLFFAASICDGETAKSKACITPLAIIGGENSLQARLLQFIRFHRSSEATYFPGSYVNRPTNLIPQENLPALMEHIANKKEIGLGLVPPSLASANVTIGRKEERLAADMERRGWTYSTIDQWAPTLALNAADRAYLEEWKINLAAAEEVRKNVRRSFSLPAKEREVYRFFVQEGINVSLQTYLTQWKARDRAESFARAAALKPQVWFPGQMQLARDLFEYFENQERGDKVDQAKGNRFVWANYKFPGSTSKPGSPTYAPDPAAPLAAKLTVLNWTIENWDNWKSIYASDPPTLQKMESMIDIAREKDTKARGFKRFVFGSQQLLRSDRILRMPHSLPDIKNRAEGNLSQSQRQEGSFEMSLRRTNVMQSTMSNWLPRMPADMRPGFKWYDWLLKRQKTKSLLNAPDSPERKLLKSFYAGSDNQEDRRLAK